MVNVLLAILIGMLWSAALYLLLRKHVIRILLGVMILGHAANLFIFVVGSLPELRRGAPALLEEGKTVASMPADPLPQALLLTAIVINLGIIAFAVVLLRRWHELSGNDDFEETRPLE
jgi:multicomponent Na+:H+ antiporter subunit C